MPLALSSAHLLLNATNKTRTQLQAELWTTCIFIAWSFRQGLWKYTDGVKVTVVTLKSLLLPSCFLLLLFFFSCCCFFFFFQDSSLIKIKIWSRDLGPWELFISLHSYKGILLFPAFLLKDSECKSLSCVQLFETLRTVVRRLPCPWNFPGQNTGVDSHCLLQGIFLTQELKSPALQADSLPAVVLNRLLSTEGCTKTASSP